MGEGTEGGTFVPLNAFLQQDKSCLCCLRHALPEQQLCMQAVFAALAAISRCSMQCQGMAHTGRLSSAQILCCRVSDTFLRFWIVQVLQAEFNRRLAIEKAQHDILCEPIHQRNTARRMAAAVRQEERKQIQQANAQLVAAAEQLHQQRLYEASRRGCTMLMPKQDTRSRVQVYMMIHLPYLPHFMHWLFTLPESEESDKLMISQPRAVEQLCQLVQGQSPHAETWKR